MSDLKHSLSPRPHRSWGAARVGVIIGMVAVIAVGFVAGVFVAPPSAAGVANGLMPRFEGSGSVLLAASILGATVMPHAIYAHSALTRDRFGADTTPLPRLLRATRWDVSIAMLIAGAVNVAILLLAAANLAGVAGTDSLEGAYAALRDGIGPVVATLFAVGLLASGLASTSVGAYAGAEIMRGLLRTPLLCRGIGRKLLTVHVVGRVSGRRYVVPVAYTRQDGALLIGTPFAWVRNLRTGEPVEIRLKGKRRMAEVEVLADERRVVEAYELMSRDNHNFAKFNRIAIAADGTPDNGDLHLAWAAGARAVRLRPA